MITTLTPNPVLDLTLTVPRILFNEMTRAADVRQDWGGKGFNVSRALQALGVPSTAMGFLGGATGHKLKVGLQALGIDVAPVTIAGETRTNIVIAESDDARYVKVNQSGPTLQPEEVDRCLTGIEERAETGDWWALCGSLPPGVPPDFYMQVISLIHAHGGHAVLDASGEPLRLGTGAGPDWIKPNAAEVAALTGRTVDSVEDAAQAVDALRAIGARNIAISMGAQGLLLAEGDLRLWARPPEIRARNPVGAGDALVAGLVFALSQGAGPEAIARWGVAAGTAAAQGAGVSVGTRADVRAIYENVTISRL